VIGICAHIRFRRIGEIFPKAHAVESIAKFDSGDNCQLFRKLDKIGFDVFPFTIDQYGEVGSCRSTLFLVSASGSPFPSTRSVISAFMLWFAAFASAARATISPTIPRWSIFAFGSSAHLDFRKRLIIIAMKIIKVRLD
jgi:hypothetical protein